MVDAHVVYVEEGRDVYGSYGVTPDRIFVTRNSPDTDVLEAVARDIFTAAAPPARKARGILFVGRLVEEKRAHLLIKAFKSVYDRFPDAELVIVGSGPQRHDLEDLVRHLRLERGVRFAGAIYDPVELGRAFASNSLFVLPGLGGLSINEAMFYGLAIVCSRGDGTEKYLVRAGHNGQFFKEDDEADLARILIQLLGSAHYLEHMGKRSKAIIEKEVNVHTVIAEYMKAFQYAIERSR
jgi:glycosyltransferase involved in cell wall biosynthesis